MNATAPFLARLGTLADPSRGRILRLLDAHELSVSELCGAVQLPQSTVSRHLKVLGEEGWVVSRSDGPSRFYRLAPRLDRASRSLWALVRAELAADPEGAQDEVRARQQLEQRRVRSREFFSTVAGQWDALRDELLGARAGLIGLLGLLQEDLVVGDLGCGTGAVSAELAPFVSRVIAVDASKAMLAAARRRLGDRTNVELRAGELEALPLTDGELDAAVMSLVLPYLPEPGAALAEAHRVLKPGGRLLIVDMMAHGRSEYRERLGHVWQGFDEGQLRAWLEGVGFDGVRWTALPPDPHVRGPVLFAAAAMRAV